MSRPATRLVQAALVVAASLVLGGLTLEAQRVLPDAVSSLANSVSGWTMLTVLLVAPVRPSLVWGAVLGVCSFVCLVLGYTIAAELTGLAYSPLRWGAVGVVAGPFVGAAAAALVSRSARYAVVGAGAVAGVLVADGIYGLTVVRASTSPVYWTLALVIGAALVLATAVRLRSLAATGGVVATTVVATIALSLGFAVLNAL